MSSVKRQDPENDQRSGKRGAEDAPHPTRKKRGRYTLNACDECKRRKTKCSGETPCQLCKSIDETCEYSRETGEEVTQKYMNSAIQSLQRQIGELSAIVNSLRNEGLGRSQAADQTSVEELSASASPRPAQLSIPTAPEPGVPTNLDSSNGPTSSAYAFNVLDSTLKHSALNSFPDPSHASAPASPPPTEADAPQKYQDLIVAEDPLAVMTANDLTRFLKLYEEDLGLQIPHLEVDKLMACVNAHAKHSPAGPIAINVDCAVKCYLKPGSDSLVRAILALMLLIEDFRNRRVAQKIMDNLEQSGSQSFAQDSNIEPDELSLIVLKALYHFLTDNERLAWRLMGFAARMCLEMGLHRRRSLTAKFTSVSERRRANKLFWCVYVLERRWSFGSGLPSAINDADVDQQLNESDTASLYLHAMISYCKIAAHVWRITSNVKSSADCPSDYDCSYLEFQVLEWRKALPSAIHLTDPHDGFDSRRDNRGVYRLRILLYLRANQMLILIHRPYLFSKNGIITHWDKAKKAIDWAKDTIKVLKRLNETSNIYSRQHMVFNHFLDSALAMLLLAVCNEPKRMADLVRKEIAIALELVHSLSTRSPISKKLWNRLKKYREMPRRLSATGKDKLGHSNSSRAQKQAPQPRRDQKENPQTGSTSGSDAATVQSFPTPTMSETSNHYDAESLMAYDSLFGPQTHILDGLKGAPNEWSGDYFPGPQDLMMASPNVPGTWALNDPSTYANITSAPMTGVGVVPVYGPQMETWPMPGNFDEVRQTMGFQF